MAATMNHFDVLATEAAFSRNENSPSDVSTHAGDFQQLSPLKQKEEEEVMVSKKKKKDWSEASLGIQDITESKCIANSKFKEYQEKFHLCEHYGKLLEHAITLGFSNVKWCSGFTILHYAAKKNNSELIQFLVNSVGANVHCVDDFMKKPIDYACPRKRDSVFTLLKLVMDLTPITDEEAEKKYQYHKDHEHDKAEKVKPCGLNIDALFEREDIATGDFKEKKDENLISMYEVEQKAPAEYKKAIKAISTGMDWNAGVGKWPNGTTLLHWAARAGEEDICKLCIVAFKADPQEEDPKSGKSAVDLARLKKHRKLAKKLAAKFKDDGKKSKKGTLSERLNAPVYGVPVRRKKEESDEE